MKTPIYAYRDHKVGFGRPFTDSNDQTAIRGFSYACRGAEPIMEFSPGDFDLYRVGEFDSEKGELIPCIPELVISGISVVNQK